MARASRHRHVGVSRLCLVALAMPVVCAWQGPSFASAVESTKLEVRADSGGGIRATAQVLFPVKTEVIQGLLTDYAHWPDLFEVGMRIANIQVESGVATVDLRINHALMPGERRLVTETRVVSEGRLETDLKGGDFTRYRRVWTLHASDEGTQTRAEFELVVKLDLMIPDWLLVMVTRQELEAHFRLLKQKAVEQTRLSSQAGPS